MDKLKYGNNPKFALQRSGCIVRQYPNSSCFFYEGIPEKAILKRWPLKYMIFDTNVCIVIKIIIVTAMIRQYRSVPPSAH